MYKINEYNRKAAAQYAEKYALKRNDDFFDYTNMGGNCTNFISQCIYAGAPKMNVGVNGWYYFSVSNTSVSWANVEPLYNFLTSNLAVGPYGEEVNIGKCEIGDIIQLKFYGKNRFSHTLVITQIKSLEPEGIIVCANTRDIKNVPLSFYVYEKFRVIHIMGYRTNL